MILWNYMMRFRGRGGWLLPSIAQIASERRTAVVDKYSGDRGVDVEVVVVVAGYGDVPHPPGCDLGHPAAGDCNGAAAGDAEAGPVAQRPGLGPVAAVPAGGGCPQAGGGGGRKWHGF